MTPRKQFLNEIYLIIDGYEETRNAVAGTVKHYAIGRWVSVEERLPESFGDYHVLDDGAPCVAYFDVFDNSFQTTEYDELHNATHWLELDLPEVEG